ncbi:hypothetical protein BT63DRAFT_202835 [Microthyrium microscopicum]|uniref:cutinase n=1 Tax=Microthyrium microscopicum TaxID=703497 RepID=A0A6A6UHD4_9PEZI|nr:hypothetical protein BT63DRAFT_202835 [Microthyrium microscopicum]
MVQFNAIVLAAAIADSALAAPAFGPFGLNFPGLAFPAFNPAAASGQNSPATGNTPATGNVPASGNAPAIPKFPSFPKFPKPAGAQGAPQASIAANPNVPLGTATPNVVPAIPNGPAGASPKSPKVPAGAAPNAPLNGPATGVSPLSPTVPKIPAGGANPRASSFPKIPAGGTAPKIPAGGSSPKIPAGAGVGGGAGAPTPQVSTLPTVPIPASNPSPDAPLFPNIAGGASPNVPAVPNVPAGGASTNGPATAGGALPKSIIPKAGGGVGGGAGSATTPFAIPKLPNFPGFNGLSFPFKKVAQGAQMFTASDVSDGKCAPVTLIFARGTGEIGNLGTVVGPQLVAALTKVLPLDSLAVQGVNYSASAATAAVNAFNPKGAAGAVSMASLINNAAEACADTKVVLAGYTQGADIVRGALMNLGQNNSVAAAVTFADPLAKQKFVNIDPAKTKVSGSSGAGAIGLGSAIHVSGGIAKSIAADVAFILKAVGITAANATIPAASPVTGAPPADASPAVSAVPAASGPGVGGGAGAGSPDASSPTDLPPADASPIAPSPAAPTGSGEGAGAGSPDTVPANAPPAGDGSSDPTDPSTPDAGSGLGGGLASPATGDPAGGLFPTGSTPGLVPSLPPLPPLPGLNQSLPSIPGLPTGNSPQLSGLLGFLSSLGLKKSAKYRRSITRAGSSHPLIPNITPSAGAKSPIASVPIDGGATIQGSAPPASAPGLVPSIPQSPAVPGLNLTLPTIPGLPTGHAPEISAAGLLSFLQSLGVKKSPKYRAPSRS